VKEREIGGKKDLEKTFGATQNVIDLSDIDSFDW